MNNSTTQIQSRVGMPFLEHNLLTLACLYETYEQPHFEDRDAEL